METEAEYKPTWESLRKHKETAEWFRDAKFGIYFHWGVYCVPAFGHEWYPNRMHEQYSEKEKERRRKSFAEKGKDIEYYTKKISGIEIKYSRGERAKKIERFYTYEFHVKNFGHPKKFGYKDFIPMFKASRFDPEKWADLFKKAGAKFAGPVAEHHDGYSMWDSDLTPFCAGKSGPKRDITGELRKAIIKRGMKFITTFHHAKNRMHYNKKFINNREYDLSDPAYAKLYGTLPEKEFLDLWKGKLIEVVDKYRPDIMWFDSWLHTIPEKTRQEYLAYYFNQAKKWGKEVGVTYKQEDLPMDVGTLDHERGAEQYVTPYAWLSDDCVSPHTWSYTEGMDFYSSERIITGFVDMVSKNGQLLLNITPKASGEIPKECVHILTEMGEWLKRNGEGIYSTRPWIVADEGKHIRFTRSKDGKRIYVFTLKWPGRELKIKNLGEKSKNCPWKIKKVSLLGSGQSLKFTRSADHLKVSLPAEKPGKYAYGFKVELANLNYKDLMRLTSQELERTKKFATYGKKRKKPKKRSRKKK
jgi:alpha-L-fucosidase